MSRPSPPRHPTEAEVNETEADAMAEDPAITPVMGLVVLLAVCLIGLAVVGALAMALVWAAAMVEKQLGLPAMALVVAFLGIVLALGVWFGPRREAERDELDDEMRSYVLRLLLREYSRAPPQRRKPHRRGRSSRTAPTASPPRTPSGDR
jgi:hypothetical protein